MSPSTATLDDERLAQLERELEASRANEETSKAALRQIHVDLKEAYLKIAQQQKKLDILGKKLRTNRDSAEAQPLIEDDQDTAPSRLTDLAHPNNLCRKLVEGRDLGNTRSPIRLYPVLEGESSARIDSLWQSLPSWTKGGISTEDAGFLDALINQVRPDQVYEIGVASGASSALILSSMAAYADPSRTWLHSYDITNVCYFDQSHAVGDATRAMVPHLLKHWKLNVRTTALDVPREKETQTQSLYFIDANHGYPWPALDLIALLPGLKAGDHVVLHDINLPTITEGRFPDYGVQWLFEDWLGERLMPDVSIPNIGAIIIPEDKNVILTSLVKTLSRPWPLQLAAKSVHLLACEQSLLEFLNENKLA